MVGSLRKLRVQIEGLDRRMERPRALGDGQWVAWPEPREGEKDRRDFSFQFLYRLKADI